MKIEQIYTGCLAQGAYYIQSGKEAAVIDPLREVQPYLDRAAKNGATIRYIFETHFHADFVSGHIDLAKATRATIIYGPTAKPSFAAQVAADNEVFRLGDVTIRVLHTPGHTMESSCFLLADEEGKEVALFSGDTLFINDVGRPDLAQKAANMTKEELAGILYDSLHNKILPLADDIVVYPAHGAGSACGKNMAKETMDTLGHQKQYNYALQPDMTRADFIAAVTEGLMPPPAYFPANARMNKEGYEAIDAVLKQGTRPLGVEAFEAAANETGALLLDTRAPELFAKGFIPNAVNIGLDGSFAPWVGALIPDIHQPILIIADEGREEEVVTRLARVGYDHSIGYLAGGYSAWVAAGKETDHIESITAEELAARKVQDPGLPIADVRKESEYNAEHIIGAENMPLDYVNDQLSKLDKDQTWYVHCAGGYRSMIFNSILRARGFDKLVDVKGGFKALKDTGKFAVSEYTRPTTML